MSRLFKRCCFNFMTILEAVCGAVEFYFIRGVSNCTVSLC